MYPSYPSIKTIKTRLSIDHDKALQIRHLIDGRMSPDHYKSVKQWIAQCLNMPSRIERIHCAINEIMEGYGIEAIKDNQSSRYYSDTGLMYVNMGDTYTPTVIYDTRKSQWIVASWGNIVERSEKRFNV